MTLHTHTLSMSVNTFSEQLPTVTDLIPVTNNNTMMTPPVHVCEHLQWTPTHSDRPDSCNKQQHNDDTTCPCLWTPSVNTYPQWQTWLLYQTTRWWHHLSMSVNTLSEHLPTVTDLTPVTNNNRMKIMSHLSRWMNERLQLYSCSRWQTRLV